MDELQKQLYIPNIYLYSDTFCQLRICNCLLRIETTQKSASRSRFLKFTAVSWKSTFRWKLQGIKILSLVWFWWCNHSCIYILYPRLLRISLNQSLGSSVKFYWSWILIRQRMGMPLLLMNAVISVIPVSWSFMHISKVVSEFRGITV